MIDPITDPRGAVAEFMRAAGQECPDKPVRLSPAIQELRRSLILEEIREFQQAADLYEKYGTNNALVAIADALADIGYVTVGAMVAHGFHAEYEINSTSFGVDRLDAESGLSCGLSQYCEAVAVTDSVAAYGGLQYLFRAVLSACDFYQIPFAAVFAEVHRSNMTKFVECEDCKGGGYIGFDPTSPVTPNYTEPCPDCSGTGYASVRRADGKILKPPSYSPPDIASVLRAHGRIA